MWPRPGPATRSVSGSSPAAGRESRSSSRGGFASAPARGLRLRQGPQTCGGQRRHGFADAGGIVAAGRALPMAVLDTGGDDGDLEVAEGEVEVQLAEFAATRLRGALGPGGR